MMRMHRQGAAAWSLAAGLAVCAVWVSAARGDDGPPPANVRVGEARSEDVTRQRLVVGRVEASRRSLVTSEQEGHVTHGPPAPGTVVKAGDVLARLDAELLALDRDAAEAELAEVEATVEERSAQLRLTARTRQYIEGLVESDAARRRELYDARDEEAAAAAQLRFAEAQRTRHEARLARLERQLERMTVRAPFDGYVVSQETEAGQWIAPGDPVAELIESGRVRVRLEAPESMVGHIQAGEPVVLQFEALAETVEAPLFSIVPDANPQSRTFGLLVLLEDAEGRLRPGMSVSAHLSTGRTVEALTVPRDAVHMTPTGTMVYANRGGRAVAVPVSVRHPAGDRFVVEGPLQSGEQVVVEGNERLTPGQPLNVTNAPAAAERAEAN